MEAIKIGNVNIPIVETHEVAGLPSSNDTTLPAREMKSISSDEAMRYFALGVHIGMNYVQTYGGMHSSFVDPAWSGGNLDLHGGVGGASFYVEAPVYIDDPLQLNVAITWGARWMTGTNTDTYLDNFAKINGYGGWPSNNSKIEREQRICAIRIKYTGNPGYFNYQFIITLATTNTSPSSESITYALGSTNRSINMRHWRNQGIEAYLEEEEVPDEEDPTDEGEPSDEDGGDGDHERIYDPIPLPTKPIMGAANAGFVTMYKLTTSQINQFSSDMFASSVWEAIKLFFSNPIDFLVGCMLLPFDPPTTGVYYPKFGTVKFEHSYPSIGDQYFDVDCGSIHVKEYWGSCFDYEPYTKMQIWLPYIGYRDLAVDEFMNQTISVKYRIDCLTGDCTAFVYTGVVGETGPQVERVIGQYYGNCGVRVPFGSVSFDAAVAAGISLMGSAATAGLSAGAGAIASGKSLSAGLNAGMKAAGSDMLANDNASIGVVQGMKPNVHRGGAAGASHGYMAVQKPYLIKRIPRQNLPAGYMQLKGYPSNIGGKLSEFSGLAVVDDIQLNNIPAMEDERAEIMQWLKGGVII